MAESLRDKLSKSGKPLLGERATNLVSMTQLAASNEVNRLKAEVLTIKNKIAQHEDLGVETSVSLRPGAPDFDPQKWVNEGIRLQLALRDATIKYTVAKAWYDRLFPEGEENDVEPVKDIQV